MSQSAVVPEQDGGQATCKKL